MDGMDDMVAAVVRAVGGDGDAATAGPCRHSTTFTVRRLRHRASPLVRPVINPNSPTAAGDSRRGFYASQALALSCYWTVSHLSAVDSVCRYASQYEPRFPNHSPTEVQKYKQPQPASSWYLIRTLEKWSNPYSKSAFR